MKFTINTIDCKNAMEKAYKATQQNSTMQVLESVIFHIEKGNNYLFGTDLDNYVSVAIDIHGCDETINVAFMDTDLLHSVYTS